METTSATDSLLVFPGAADKDFTIDKNDYHVVREILLDKNDYHDVRKLLLRSGMPEDPFYKRAQEIVGIKEDDEERRVYALSLIGKSQIKFDISSTDKLSNLQDEIENLTSLNRLNLECDLHCSGITQIPSSIGHLKYLQVLNLQYTTNLVTLPEEIGDLASLNELDLYASRITSLPSSIGRLKHLQVLDLSLTIKLLNLPEEIGDLISLNKLELRYSNITSLPPSIGRLKNLQNLNLTRTTELLQLPKEIGDLTNLYKLEMFESAIRKLPEEIGNLKNLKVLDLESLSITSLPDSIGKLKGLMKLDLNHTHIPELQGSDPNNFLLMLVQSCQSLGSFGYDTPHNKKVRYALACNRARFRIRFGKNDKESESSTQLIPKLWPLIINRATRAFDRYSAKMQNYCPYFDSKYEIETLDAIHKLLVDGSELFIEILVDRNTKDNPAGTKGA